MRMSSFLLFIGNDKRRQSQHDVGSTLCLAMLDRWPEHPVVVRAVSDIAVRDRPHWLRGTPTLVQRDTNACWTGYAALSVLTDMAFAQLQTTPPPATRATGAKQSGEAATASAPPAEGSDALAGVWENSDVPQVDDEQDERATRGKNNKLSQEDYALAMKERSQTSASGNVGGGPVGSSGGLPPMLEPLND